MLPWQLYFDGGKKKIKKDCPALIQCWFVKVDLKTLLQLAVVDEHRLAAEQRWRAAGEKCCCSVVFLGCVVVLSQAAAFKQEATADIHHFIPKTQIIWQFPFPVVAFYIYNMWTVTNSKYHIYVSQIYLPNKTCDETSVQMPEDKFQLVFFFAAWQVKPIKCGDQVFTGTQIAWKQSRAWLGNDVRWSY